MNMAVTVESVIDLNASSTTIGLGFSRECHFPCLQCCVAGIGHNGGVMSTKERC